MLTRRIHEYTLAQAKPQSQTKSQCVNSRSVICPLQSAMRMLSASKLCFTVLLAAFQCHTQAEISSRLHSILDGGEGFENVTGCTWNCKVIQSDFPEERLKAMFATSNGMIKLVVKYEKKVDEKCVNPTIRDLSGNATENFIIRLLSNNKHNSTFSHTVESFFKLIFSSYAGAHHREIKVRAVCKLKPGRRTTAATPFHNSETVLPRFIRGHLADHGVDLQSIDCKEKEKDNLPCTNVTRSQGNTEIKSLFKQDWLIDWLKHHVFVLLFVFLFVFLYSPTFLCFFCSSMVTENGICQMSLEGASPVSFRSLMGNWLYYEIDTFWHRTRSLILRVVVLPLPFLVPAAIVNYGVYHPQQQNKNMSRLLDFSRPFMLVSFASYFLKALYDSFFDQLSHFEKPCLVCRWVKPNFTCANELPRRILNHLRIQPLILVKCWRLFLSCLKSYFKLSQIILPSWKVSASWFLLIPAFIVFLSTIPAVTVLLLVTMPVVAIFGILLTSPLALVLSGFKRKTENSLNRHSLIVRFLRDSCVSSLSSLAIYGVFVVLLFLNIGIISTIFVSFELLLRLSEESLPFVACFVLVWYYLSNSYSSFTNKYQDLSLSLFKIYKTSCSRHDQISNEELHTEAVREVPPNPDKNGHVVRIPKELFDMACEELKMPIREGFCLLLFKVALILSFVSLTFMSIMRLHVGATPVTKALVTFFTGSFPKIVTIYFEGGRQKKLQAMIVEEKAPKIVQEYINGTPRANQGQNNPGANTDEVIFVHENEENIELLSM